MSSSKETPTKNITGDSNKKVMEQPYPFITVSPVQSTCKICNKTFKTNRENLRKHMTLNHSDDYSFPQWNGISEVLLTKEQDAKSHWKSFVKTPLEFENRPKCNGCNKLFSRIDAKSPEPVPPNPVNSTEFLPYVPPNLTPDPTLLHQILRLKPNTCKMR